MPSGSEFAQSIATLDGFAREQRIRDALAARNVPWWASPDRFLEVSVKRVLSDGLVHQARYRVSSDVASIGTEAPFRVPMYPNTAQWWADENRAILPSRQMSLDIWRSSDAKVEPHPYAPTDGGFANQRTARWIESNAFIDAQLAKMGASPGTALIAGDKKDVVIGPGLDGSKVAIYGWHRPTGAPWQPYATPHPWDYSDYSHGVRLIARDALVDGRPMDLVDVFQDRMLSALVSDQGPFNPRFPNMVTPTTPNYAQAMSGVRSASTLPLKASSSGPPVLAISFALGAGALLIRAIAS